MYLRILLPYLVNRVKGSLLHFLTWAFPPDPLVLFLHWAVFP